MNGTPKIEPAKLSDWLLYEEDDLGRYSRETVTVAGGQNLKCGSVVGLTGDGTQYVEYTNLPPDGADAVGIVINPIVTEVGTPGKTVIIARHARIAKSGLAWGVTINQTAKDEALVDLATKGIIAVPAEA